jgi:hypothetical protein
MFSSIRSVAGRFYIIRTLLLAMAFGGLAWLALAGTKVRIYDERYYLERSDQLVAGRNVGAVFSEPSQSAVGPLFPLLQSLVLRAFDDVRACRVANVLFALCCTACLATLLRAGKKDWSTAFFVFCASPFVVSSVLALTEILTALLSFSAFAVLIITPADRLLSRGRIVASGLLLGFAVLTRQTSIVLLGPLVVFLVQRKQYDLPTIGLACFPSLAAGLWLLTLWGGLTPPGQEFINETFAFSAANAFKGLCYCSIMAVIMEPTIIWSRRRAVLVLVGAVINVALAGRLFVAPVLLSLFPEGGRWTAIFQSAYWGAAIVVVICFLVDRFMAATKDTGLMAGTLAILVVCLTCGFITHQFSSRYVVTAIPFLVLVTRRDSHPVTEAVSTLGGVVGFFGGVASLHSYALM